MKVIAESVLHNLGSQNIYDGYSQVLAPGSHQLVSSYDGVSPAITVVTWLHDTLKVDTRF